jgi:hypothetical protein
MPKTLVKDTEEQIIGGTFSNRDNADKAIRAFREMGIPDENIEVLLQLSDKQAEEVSKDILTDRGFADTQAAYYEKAIRKGKILVVVYGVDDSAPIIDVFDKYKAEYNPDGSRNVREDVTGMTAGAALGAVAGGAVGAAVGGLAGGAIGGAAGAVVGGGGGAAAGKAAEHRK